MGVVTGKKARKKGEGTRSALKKQYGEKGTYARKRGR